MPVSPRDLAKTLVRRASARRDADDRARDRCRREVLREIPALRRELGVGRVWLIGSLAWGGFGVRSDIDVVIEGGSTEAATAIGERLGEVTGRPVDVLVFETLPPGFQERVLSEGHHVP